MQAKPETITVALPVDVTLASLVAAGIIEDAAGEEDAATLLDELLHPDAEKITDRDIDETHPRDKTEERMREKLERAKISERLGKLYREAEKLGSSHGADAGDQTNHTRVSEIESEIRAIEEKNHERDIPEEGLSQLIAQQDAFELRLFNSTTLWFVTSIRIDIDSQEIQVWLNNATVNSTNIRYIVSDLEDMMPPGAPWHAVYSTPAETASCTQRICAPIIGGNYIEIDSADPKRDVERCSFGFKAKKGTTWGWITAGHCAESQVGEDVRNARGSNIGTVSVEKYYRGTYCDCAWIVTSSSNTTNDMVYGGGLHRVTNTTSQAQQQNDTIMKSGQASGVTFGTISALHVTVLNLLDGEIMRDLVRSNVAFKHGDSGGPIVASGDKGNLYWILTTHDLWGVYHAAYDNIADEMDITAVLN